MEMVALSMSVHLARSIHFKVWDVMPEYALAVARGMLMPGHYNSPSECSKFHIVI